MGKATQRRQTVLVLVSYEERISVKRSSEQKQDSLTQKTATVACKWEPLKEKDGKS